MKDFILITVKGCVTYENVFPLFKEEKVSFGYTRPTEYMTETGLTTNMKGLTRWITTLPVYDKQPLMLTKHYAPEAYPKYDNYNAINVDRIKDIPMDYEGEMGVPITIFDYDLQSATITGKLNHNRGESYDYGIPKVAGEEKYARILVKGILKGDYCTLDEYTLGHTPILDGEKKYSRIILKRR